VLTAALAFWQTIPFARHSPLPELQALVALLRPATVYPNTIVARQSPMELLCLPACFPSLSPTEHGQLARLASWWCQAFAADNREDASPTAVWDRTVALVEQASIRETLAGLFPPSSAGPPPSMADLKDIDASHLVGTKAEQLELNLTIHAAYAALPPPPPTERHAVSGWGGTGGQAKAGRMWTAAAAMLRELESGQCEGKGKGRAWDLSERESQERSSHVRLFLLGRRS
jgi:hypothetical protein